LRPPIRESAGTGNAGSGPQVLSEIKRNKRVRAVLVARKKKERITCLGI
jgi:hypothetical protein